MKELSTEQKAQRYDKALEKARQLCAYPTSKPFISDLQDLFPELKESKDGDNKRISKEITQFLKQNNGWNREWIAWLEKQGEQKPADKVEPKFRVGDTIKCKYDCRQFTIKSVDLDKGTYTYTQEGCGNDIDYADEEFELVEKKPADKVEPKFKVGDWITDGYLHYKITDVLEDRYVVDTKFVNRSAILFNNESHYHLWTIQDAKDGDVLAAKTTIGYPNPFIAIYKEHGLNFFNSHCFVSWDGEFHEGTTGHSISDIHPATKEQCDFLFQKMKEAGYELDAKKKELKKIEQKPAEWSEDNLPEFESYLCLMFQKFRTKGICTNGEIIDYVNEHSQKLKDILCHAWSEEDEMIALSIEQVMNCASLLNIVPEKIDKIRTWLKSLKYRVQSQPKQEWSEEDERLIEEATECLRKYASKVQGGNSKVYVLSLADRIESLRPQTTWKPSDEQMQALSNAGNSFRPFEEGHKVLWSLYNDLKKLREK